MDGTVDCCIIHGTKSASFDPLRHYLPSSRGLSSAGVFVVPDYIHDNNIMMMFCAHVFEKHGAKLSGDYRLPMLKAR
jgi:hypothetical protein